MIKITNLCKSFGYLNVLNGINLQVEKGEVVAILGSSGTGKSTLLRCLNFLDLPDKGEIIIDDAKINAENYTKNDLKLLRSKSTMVFQEYNLFKNKTAVENIVVPLVYSLNMPVDDAYEEAYKLIEKVGLMDKADTYPSKMSGGQQQRVAIARAMSMNPKLFLFDEPTSSLDPKLVNEVLEVIRKLIAEHNTTILIVTHEMKFANEVADRIIYMDGGKILEDTTPDIFFTNPKTDKSKNFLRFI